MNSPGPRGYVLLAAFLASLGAAPAPRGIETRSDLQPAFDTGALWLAPHQSPAATKKSPLAEAVEDLANGRAAKALPIFSKAPTDSNLLGYSVLYLGRTHLALGRPADASAAAQQLLQSSASGYLQEAALWLATDAAEASSDWPAALRALETLSQSKSLNPERVFLRLGRVAVKAGDRQRAIQSFTTTYYQFALTAEADEAATELAKLTAPGAPVVPQNLRLELARAQQFYGARRYRDARKAFEPLRGQLADDDRALVELRLAQCDYYLKRYPIARDALRGYLDKEKTRLAEAQFHYFSTLRELGRYDEYVALARVFIDSTQDTQLAEEALNNLGTHHILLDDDASAADTFAELYRRFPEGVHADRAAWKAGWWAYRTGAFDECIRLFESAALQFPRADYRPWWLYWSARAHSRRGDRDAAIAGFRLVIADYRNSYYGRQAARELARIIGDASSGASSSTFPMRRDLASLVPLTAPPPNAPVIRSLLAAGLYDDAILELREAERQWGVSARLEATIAYALNRKGELRPAITTMRRAYPQFMASGGEALPTEIRAIIFPLAYWNLIHKYATAEKLDPYLMAALIAQESTFEADVRSVADAWGLMQVLPSTGRRYASRLGIRSFRTSFLTRPEINIRIGMSYFADLLKQYGDVVFALAAYNAGEARVSRWIAERPGMDRDQFIDDIPFPETQNYLKRILGTAEDYRVLYRDLKP